MAKAKKYQISDLQALLKERYGELPEEQGEELMSALVASIEVDPAIDKLTVEQYELGAQVLEMSVSGQAESFKEARAMLLENPREWVESQANEQLESAITEANKPEVSGRTAEEILTEIDMLDRLAHGTATNVAALLARDGFANAQEARKAYNLLYAQRLREYVESGELERRIYEMQEEQTESLPGKPLGLVEQAKALIASRTSRALPEGTSN